jgi:amino acid adenylation domain-containing protein
VVQGFESQVNRQPDAIAIHCGNDRLTYAQLNAKANHLAHFLLEAGIQRQQVVALCLQRSSYLLTAMLACLKAGATYLPLDPDYPQERLAYMLDDAQVCFLLHDQSSRAALPAQYLGMSLSLDDLRGQHHNTTNPNQVIFPEQTAYIIYTSGSTGYPKGVPISHRAVCNFLQSMQQTPGMTNDDRCLAVTSLSFDIAVLELLLPLQVGAQIVLAEQQEIHDAKCLMALLEQHRITIMQATPSTWRLLIAADWSGSPALRLLSGGEALPSSLAQQLRSKGISLWNMYGPTETTIWSSCSEVTHEAPTIGQAIANTQIYVVNSQLQPVAIGSVGEILIGGAGLSIGYSDRAALTAERFIPNPFCEEAGERLYRTGDLGRYRSDGQLECLGRVDQQVKLRGYRIELGEIEAALESHEAVISAAVVLRGEGGSQRLQAYITCLKNQKPVADDDLREHLQARLPHYMIPALFHTLDAIPLTPNGKIDRNALPEINSQQRDITTYAAPRNAVESALQTFWCELLKLDNIGINENFFELGGHSFLVLQLASLIDKKYDIRLEMREIFLNPTIAKLARIVTDSSSNTSSSLITSFHSLDQDPANCINVILIHPLGGTVLRYANLANYLSKAQPCYAIQSSGLNNDEPIYNSVDKMADHYLNTLAANNINGPYFIIGYSMGSYIAYEMAQKILNSNTITPKLAGLCIIDTSAIFDLTINDPNDDLELIKILSSDRDIQLDINKLRELNKTEQRHAITSALREIADDELIDDETLWRLFQVRLNNFRAMSLYKPLPYNGKLILISSDESRKKYSADNFFWDTYAQTVIHHLLEGDHLGIIMGSSAEKIYTILSKYLDR